MVQPVAAIIARKVFIYSKHLAYIHITTSAFDCRLQHIKALKDPITGSTENVRLPSDRVLRLCLAGSIQMHTIMAFECWLVRLEAFPHANKPIRVTLPRLVKAYSTLQLDDVLNVSSRSTSHKSHCVSPKMYFARSRDA